MAIVPPQPAAGKCCTTDEELAASRERMQHDRCADTASPMQWVPEAGFADAGLRVQLVVVGGDRRLVTVP